MSRHSSEHLFRLPVESCVVQYGCRYNRATYTTLFNITFRKKRKHGETCLANNQRRHFQSPQYKRSFDYGDKGVNLTVVLLRLHQLADARSLRKDGRPLQKSDDQDSADLRVRHGVALCRITVSQFPNQAPGQRIVAQQM